MLQLPLLCSCVASIWMSSNRLWLNAGKTQFIWLGSSQMLAKTNKEPLSVSGVDILPLNAVHDLGVILDSNLTMKKHVDGIIRSCCYQLRQLRSIHRSLTFDAVLAPAFIHSWVDYRNAILFGVGDGVIRKLQSVLHAAARLVTGVHRNDQITLTLHDVLHWLPVQLRIAYRIAMMTFSYVRCTGPAYFSNVCTPVQMVAGCDKLNSARHGHIIVPAMKTKTFGSRSFSSAARTICNSLPANLLDINISWGQSAKGLRTWLFGCAYT